MSDFRWTKEKGRAAVELAAGRTQGEVARLVGCSRRTVERWVALPEFAAEVDRLSVMIDVAARAARVRLAQSVVRSKIKDGVPQTRKDLLDWLKFVQRETDGLNLGLGERT